MLYVRTSLITDGLIELSNNKFDNNYAGISGGVMTFMSETGTGETSFEYCDDLNSVCGIKVSIVECNVTNNGVNFNLTQQNNGTYGGKLITNVNGGAFHIHMVHNDSFPNHEVNDTSHVLFSDSLELLVTDCIFDNNGIITGFSQQKNGLHNDYSALV